MVHVQFNPELLSSLNDKVVVLTGGATGIGRSAVIQFAGALITAVYGKWAY
jgi:NAD(P)-dependent dehydrogenase (short-subunit alcohol dehydrogenase family)